MLVNIAYPIDFLFGYLFFRIIFKIQVKFWTFWKLKQVVFRNMILFLEFDYSQREQSHFSETKNYGLNGYLTGLNYLFLVPG